MVFDNLCIVVDGAATVKCPPDELSTRATYAMKSFKDGQSSNGGFLISSVLSPFNNSKPFRGMAFETSLKISPLANHRLCVDLPPKASKAPKRMVLGTSLVLII